MTSKEQDNKTFNAFVKDIERAKRKLEKQKCYENFGQKEVRELRDKYSDYMSGNWSVVGRFIERLNSFEDWCGNYNNF